MIELEDKVCGEQEIPDMVVDIDESQDTITLQRVAIKLTSVCAYAILKMPTVSPVLCRYLGKRHVLASLAGNWLFCT